MIANASKTLIAAAMAMIAMPTYAGMDSNSNDSANLASEVPVALEKPSPAYESDFAPSLNDRLDLYHQLIKLGAIEEVKGPMRPSLNDEYLWGVWDLAVERGWVDPESYRSDDAESKNKPQIDAFNSGAKITGACIGNVAGCTLGLAGGGLACAATFLSDGIAAVLGAGAACVGGITGGGASCTAIRDSCRHPDRPRASTRYVGRVEGSERTLYCADTHYVDRITVTWRDGVTGKLVARCTNGEELVFGRMVFAGGAFRNSHSCNPGALMDGFTARSGARLDALGIRCGRVGGTAYSSLPPMGGSGGGPATEGCPAHQHVNGFTVFYEGSGLARRSNLLAIAAHCD
ncbi:MAG: hypothetical protein MUE46_18460 [Xanthomonadales bacterium]|nr:hypothetical protein [Xanthomonadales bacterium]